MKTKIKNHYTRNLTKNEIIIQVLPLLIILPILFLISIDVINKDLFNPIINFTNNLIKNAYNYTWCIVLIAMPFWLLSLMLDSITKSIKK